MSAHDIAARLYASGDRLRWLAFVVGVRALDYPPCETKSGLTAVPEQNGNESKIGLTTDLRPKSS